MERAYYIAIGIISIIIIIICTYRPKPKSINRMQCDKRVKIRLAMYDLTLYIRLYCMDLVNRRVIMSIIDRIVNIMGWENNPYILDALINYCECMEDAIIGEQMGVAGLAVSPLCDEIAYTDQKYDTDELNAMLGGYTADTIRQSIRIRNGDMKWGMQFRGLLHLSQCIADYLCGIKTPQCMPNLV